MNIPYVSALGEGDEECVSLANHLDCYLVSRDSDYYCYKLLKGYIPFDYVDINPIQKHSYYYLSAQLYTIESLCERFIGLNHLTLSLACCVCGNDYIDENTMQPIINHIVATVDKPNERRSNRTKHWYALQWVRHFENVEVALEKLLQPIKNLSERKKIETKIQSTLQFYINPKDTLIYRFNSSTNQNLLKNSYFVELARRYLDMVTTNLFF